MSKRLYYESLKKWLIGLGATGGTIGISIFIYLSMVGAIEITGYSGDQICRGDEDNPCYAYINFSVKEDIFIYPMVEGVDPWGRETPFNFDPNVKSWKLQRSWGEGWRNIPLNKSCTGTWCGLSNSDDVRKFSIAFREGRDYEIRIVAYKNNPYESIKWGAFDLDPTWLAAKPVYNCKKYTDKKIITGYTNVTEYNKYEDCKTWVMKEKGECVFDLKADRTETYKNGTCVQCFNVTESYIVVTPIYGTEQICEIQNRDGIELTDGYVNFTELNVVGNVEDNVLTLKDLSRGGSFKDHNLDECYNQGVPCTQIKLDTLNYISLVKDDDKISIEDSRESKKLVTNEITK